MGASVPQRPSRQTQEDVLKIGLDDLDTRCGKARVEERRQQRGQAVRALVREHVETIVHHRGRVNAIEPRYHGHCPVQPLVTLKSYLDAHLLIQASHELRAGALGDELARVYDT